MSLIGIVIVLIVIGVALYLVQLVPMDGTIKRIISILVIVVVIIWILTALFPGAIGHSGIHLR
jgi:hypothetical protein